MSSVGDVTVELRARADKLEHDLRAGQRHVEGFTQRAGSAFSRLGASIITFNQAAQLASSVGRTFGAAFQSVVRAAGEAQQAVAALDQTLRSTGQYTRGYSDELRDLAARLMVLTGNSDEAILGVERQLVAFGATRKQIEPFTKAVLDLSTGMGRDLNGAALLVGRALAGNFTMLGRMGIAVDENASSAVKLEQALGAIARRFGGQAEAQARTYEGRMRILSELFGELEESIGGAIVNSQSFDRVLGRVQDLLARAGESTAGWVDANRGLIDQRIEQVFAAIGAAAEALPAHIDVAARAIAQLKDAWDSLSPELKGAILGGAAGGPYGAIAGATAGLVSREGVSDTVAAWVARMRVDPSRVSGDVQKRLRRRQSLNYDPLLDVKLANVRADREIAGQFVGPTQPDFVGPPELVGPPEPGAPRTPAVTGAASAPPGGDGASERVQKADDALKLEEALARVKASQEGLDEARITRAETQVALAERALDVAQNTGASTKRLLALAEQLDAAEQSKAQAQIAALEAQTRAYDITTGEAEALHAEIEKINAELAAGPTHVQKLTAELGKASTAGGDVATAFKQGLSDFILGTGLGTGGEFDFKRLFGGLAQRLLEPALNRAIDSGVSGIGNLASGLFGGTGTGSAGAVGGRSVNDFAGNWGLPAGATVPGASGTATASGGATGAAGAGALGGIGAGGWIGLAIMAVQGAVDATRAGRAARLKVGATEDQALDAARKAFPLGSLLIPPARFTNGKGIAGNLGPLADPLGIMTGLRMLGVFRPPSAERQLSSVIGSLFKQAGVPGIPSLNRLNLRAEGAGGLDRRAGFEVGGPLDLAALTVGTQLGRALPELPEQRYVAGRTRNALLNTLSALGLSLEDSRDKIAELGRSLNGSIGDAVLRFNQLRTAGHITEQTFDELTAGAIENFDDLVPAIDAARLATLALSDEGVLSLKRLQRAVDDAQAAVGGGITASFNALVESGSAADAAEALGDQFGQTFQARVAERLLQSETIGRALTEAATLAEQLAEARAAGEVDAASALQAQLRDVYQSAQRDYISAVTPIALATRGDLRLFSRSRAANGSIIDEADLTLPRFAMGGTVSGPYGAPQLAVVHGGEHVYTPQQSEQITGMLSEILGAMRRGANVHVTVQPAAVQIDGRDLVAATDRARALQRTGNMTPEAIGLRG